MQCPDMPVLAQISVAHCISHIYILAIPAVLPLLPDALGVSFVELGVAVSLFNILSAFLQTPMGFAVDRFGARRVLVSGIAVGSASCFFFLALFPSYTGLLIASGLLGAANAVYHPSDYAILSRTVKESIMGRAFSIHAFAGFAGSAATPFLVTTIALFSGLSAAFGALGVMGILVLFMFAFSRPERARRQEGENAPPAGRKGCAVSVFTVPVLVLAVLYMLLSLSTATLERFTASALIQGYGVGLPVANTALTAYLICSAVGVLSGGLLADRTRRHGYVAATAFAGAAVLMAVVAAYSLPPVPLVILFALIGFLTGVIVPSRDMLVRAASPRGGEGKVFGIVSTGFNVAGTIGPVLCGYFLDHGLPSLVFWAAMVFMILTVMLTWFQERHSGRDAI